MKRYRYRYRYRRTKESKKRQMLTLLRRLEEKAKTPAGAKDKEIGQLIAAVKKHLGVKDDDVRQTASPEPPGPTI